MKLFHIVEEMMLKLSGIPGLHFLGAFVMEHQAESARRQQAIGKYKSYVEAVRGAAAELTEHGHGDDHGHGPDSKKHAHAKVEKSEDFEEADEDYEDEDDDYESFRL